METEEERQARWKKRIEEMKREKRRTQLLHRLGMVATAVLAIAIGCFVGIGSASFLHRDVAEDGADDKLPEEGADFSDSSMPNEYVILLGESLLDSGRMMLDTMFDIDGQVAKGELPGVGHPEGELSNSEEGLSDGELSNGGEGYSDGKLPNGGEGLSDGELPEGVVVYPGGELSANGEELSEDVVPVDAAVPMGENMPAGNQISVGVQMPAEEPIAVNTPVFTAHSTLNTVGFHDTIISEYGVFIDVAEGTILAQKDAMVRMNPASMSKILTVLVAAEHISEFDLEDTVSITRDITDYCYVHGCSVTGYDVDEVVTVKDLFYGTVLPSGADSALALAAYVAGSHEAFVGLMNEKIEELGLAESTHFTNCVGLYDEDHYSTAYDIAVILETAVSNAFCRDVLSTHIYTTNQTEQHPEGLRVSNWFLRRIEDRDTHGEVLCGKTGYVDQSGSCAASFCIGNDGKEYLCVTAGSSSSWTCIADQVELYQRFIPEQSAQ